MIVAKTASDPQKGMCVAHGLFYGFDESVAQWTWNEFGLTPMHINGAIGIVRNNQLVGSILFQNFSGYNVEVSYYGKNTLSHGILKSIGIYLLARFSGLERITVRTNRKNVNIMRVLHRMGFRMEGIQKRFYGPYGDSACFVLFREEIERISGVKKDKRS